MPPVLVAMVPSEDSFGPGLELLRATKTSDVNKLGRAIARVATDHDRLDLRAIGAAAVNQAVKAVVVANSLLAPRGVHLVLLPRFETVDGDHAHEISALTFRVRTEEN